MFKYSVFILHITNLRYSNKINSYDFCFKYTYNPPRQKFYICLYIKLSGPYGFSKMEILCFLLVYKVPEALKP